MVDSVYDVIKEKVTVKSGFKPVQLNINAEKREQLKHPYIPYKLAEIIVNNRKTNGNYATIDDKKTLPLMKAEIYSKIKPYLKVE
ncbi:MAG: helix-hairpin-helix domain-containing protein [Bacteroidetes bacterium]|nr:helix-hairpin-helix domain-containing protein [Bacteroidota bacterium]